MIYEDTPALRKLGRKILSETFEGFTSFPKPTPRIKNNRQNKPIRGRKGKKGKTPTRKSLVRKLDEIVSKIVIKRDMVCVVCGSVKQLGCGHIFSRSHYSTRWDLENCHAQCWPCNYKHKIADPMPYYEWFQKKGAKKFKTLYNRWKTIKKFSTKDLQVMLKKYEKNKR